MSSVLDNYTVQLECHGTFVMDPKVWIQTRFELRDPVLHQQMEATEELIILGVSVHLAVETAPFPEPRACYVNIVRSNQSVLGLYLPNGFYTPPFAIHVGGTERVEFHRDPRGAVASDVFIRGWRKGPYDGK